MELLWTDQCFLLMILAAAALLINGLRKKRIRLVLGGLFKQPQALCSGIILLFFTTIGVLDCIHLKAESHAKSREGAVSDIVSVLDRMLAPLGQTYEKTYSSPLALTLYTTEIMPVSGRLVQTWPRLQYPPESIQNEHDRHVFICHELLRALLWSSFCVMALSALLLVMRRYRGLATPITASVWGLITVFLCLFCVLASYWLSRKLHLFGTGKIGQDIFYYSVKSIRTGLIIGTLTTIFMLPLAIVLGIASGYFGGLVDDIIQYVYTTLSSIPGVLLITASVLSMQTYIANHPLEFATLDKSADARLLALCLILGVTSWTGLCRLLRAEALKFRNIDFVLAARALGSGRFRILQKHLLPNVMPLVLITVVLDFSFLVLAEAVLSYVGVGVSPMTISWGNMINGARLELARDPIVWWPMLAAFVFMFVLVLASNIFADTVRDAFNPETG